ncbi:MAG: VIT1/CCC1 transporter family protein [Chitinophagaceae bacterium]|nr:VIT1/CCC1 transporter family protein [Chitinophagaceae bacterium]
MQRKEKRKRPSEYAVNIGASYLLGGLVPLLPYLLFTKPEVLSISISITLTLIFILGVMKSKSLLLPWWRESSRLTLQAILATSGAFATGYFFF